MGPGEGDADDGDRERQPVNKWPSASHQPASTNQMLPISA